MDKPNTVMRIVITQTIGSEIGFKLDFINHVTLSQVSQPQNHDVEC